MNIGINHILQNFNIKREKEECAVPTASDFMFADEIEVRRMPEIVKVEIRRRKEIISSSQAIYCFTGLRKLILPMPKRRPL